MFDTKAYSAASATSPLASSTIIRRDPTEHDGQIEILYCASSFDFTLNRASADHDIPAYINLLRRDGTLTVVGAPEKPLSIPVFGLIMGRRRCLSGSPIRGIAETQEMLDFGGAHNITADVEIIPIQKVNEA